MSFIFLYYEIRGNIPKHLKFLSVKKIGAMVANAWKWALIRGTDFLHFADVRQITWWKDQHFSPAI